MSASTSESGCAGATDDENREGAARSLQRRVCAVGPWGVTCLECELWCRDKLSLQLHMDSKTHVGKRVRKCDVCGGVCFSLASLSRHKLEHQVTTDVAKPENGANVSRPDDPSNTPAQSAADADSGTCHVCKASVQDGLRWHMHIRHRRQCPKPFKCVQCKVSLSSPKHLVKHMKSPVHVDFQCSVCGEFLPSPVLLGRHVLHHGTPRVAAVDSTSAPGSDAPGNATSHSAKPTSDAASAKLTAYSLVQQRRSLGYKRFRDLCAIDRHTKSSKHSASASCRCRWCGAAFPSRARLARHIVGHHLSGQPAADTSEETASPGVEGSAPAAFGRLDAGNVLRVRGKQGRYSCEPCGVSFNRIANLNRHLTTKLHSTFSNTPGSVARCRLCAMDFPSVGDLRRHQATHADRVAPVKAATRRVYSCPKCGVSFDAKQAALKHAATASHGLALKCRTCDCALPSVVALRRHNVGHRRSESRRPAESRCDICGLTLATADLVADHRRSHFWAGLPQCQLCEATFVSTDHLARHLRNHRAESSAAEAAQT